jgi:outer membrane protein insertion porin family
MRNGCFGFYILIFCFFAAPVEAATQNAMRNSRYEIGDIRIVGNRSISNTRILSRIVSRVGELFDPAVAAEDTKRIAELDAVQYSYYNTEVVEDKIRLTFAVIEKNIVRSIAFIGNKKLKTDTLRRKLNLKIGDYLDPVLAEVGRRAIAETYQKNGFAIAQVTLDNEKLSYGELVFTIDEGPRVKIEKVVFSGNKAIKTPPLRNAIKTKKKKFFFWPRYYTEQDIDKDITRLQNIYNRKGYLDADITLKRQFNKDKSKVRLAFVIDEGAVYTVENITFTGNAHFNEQKLRAESKLKRGDVYIEQKADIDVKHLLKLYRENGFIDVKVEQRRTFLSKSTIDVEFEITEGRRFRIGRINITGNEQTQDKVIRRVLDEYDFLPGSWYNADIARGDGTGQLEKTVRSTVLTESATITPSGELPGQKDAQVSIIEGQTGMVMVGAGVASDSGVIGQMIFEQRNFDIKDWPESFTDFITGQAFKGAGQDLRIALEPGTEVSQYSISFSEPYFKDKPITLDVIASSWERWFESYDEGRTKGYVGLEKRYKNRWRRSIGFKVENVEVDSLDTDAPKEIIDVKGDNALASVALGISKDLTDDRFNPTTGYIFSAGYEQAAGDHTFGILSGTYRHYRTIHEDLAERKTVLAAKLHAATAIGDAPPFEKFYAGGMGSIRGFDYRGVSTRGLQTNVPAPERKDPIGSDWIFLANAEVTVPLVGESLAALFFVDSGTIDSGSYRAAVGTGIQIMIPQWFGPVPMRFEFAAPVMKDDDDQTQVFSFSVGRLF